MEARLFRAALVAAAACCLGAGHRTQNFIVTAATPQLAVEVGEAAERYRRELALEWLGAELPAWEGPCPITVQVGPRMGASGVTSFMFDRGRPFGWTMSVLGTRERVLDSVLPHEVTHTIFATHYGRPLPRWADEGACTTVEHASERNKQQELLITFLTTNRGIAFNKMFAMKEYPHDVLPLYSQGHSLVRYLLAQGGKQKFVRYVGDGMNTNNWTASTQKHYGFSSLSELQVTWLEWVRRGSPDLKPNEQLAAAPAPAPTNEELTTIVRPAKNNSALGNRALSPVGPPADAGTPDTNRPRPGAPAPTDLTSNAAPVGWYAKQRDLAVSKRGTSDAKNAAPAQAGGSRSNQHNEPEQPYSTTKPQPIGRPEQVILEWSRAPASPVPPGPIYQAGQGPIRR